VHGKQHCFAFCELPAVYFREPPILVIRDYPTSKGCRKLALRPDGTQVQPLWSAPVRNLFELSSGWRVLQQWRGIDAHQPSGRKEPLASRRASTEIIYPARRTERPAARDTQGGEHRKYDLPPTLHDNARRRCCASRRLSATIVRVGLELLMVV